MVDKCSHGKLWTEPCDDCEMVSLRSFIMSWEGKVIKAKERIEELYKKKGLDVE